MSDLKVRETNEMRMVQRSFIDPRPSSRSHKSVKSVRGSVARSDHSQISGTSAVQFNDSVHSISSIKITEKSNSNSSRILKSNLRSSITGVAFTPDIAPRLRKNQLPVYTKSDSSVYPSYTNLILPYRVVCRQRYQNAINKHHEQFIKEIRLHERLQPYALGGVRLRREFCDPVLVKVAQKDKIYLTLEEERRLEYILKTDPRSL